MYKIKYVKLLFVIWNAFENYIKHPFRINSETLLLLFHIFIRNPDLFKLTKIQKFIIKWRLNTLIQIPQEIWLCHLCPYHVSILDIRVKYRNTYQHSDIIWVMSYELWWSFHRFHPFWWRPSLTNKRVKKKKRINMAWQYWPFCETHKMTQTERKRYEEGEGPVIKQHFVVECIDKFHSASSSLLLFYP